MKGTPKAMTPMKLKMKSKPKAKAMERETLRVSPWEGIEPPTGVKKDRMEFIDAALQRVRKIERRLGLSERELAGVKRPGRKLLEIELPELPSARAMGKELGVDEKTVRLTIREMRDLYGMPIEPVPARHGYRYTEDVNFSPLVQFSESELVSVYLTQKLGMLEGTPFQPKLASVFGKMVGITGGPEKLSFKPELLDECFSFETDGPHARMKPAHLDACARAMLRQEELLITYTKQYGEGAGVPEVRRVRPVHITYRDFAFYVLCIDLKRAKKPRLFMVTRMNAVEETGVKFERPRDFDARAHLEKAWKLFASEEAVTVVLRFAPDAAGRIVERRWHHTQNLKPLEDGSLEMTMQCGLAPDLYAWIGGFFSEVAVLEPGELRDRMRELHAGAAGLGG